jgi:hypothetical protein
VSKEWNRKWRGRARRWAAQPSIERAHAKGRAARKGKRQNSNVRRTRQREPLWIWLLIAMTLTGLSIATGYILASVG